MSSGTNKELLVEFLCIHWSTYLSSQLNSLTEVYLTSRDKCIRLAPRLCNSDPVLKEEVPELESDHEEADTRLILHAKHASSSHDRIIVKTPDTDVFLLCTAMQTSIAKPLYVMTGTGNKLRLIDVKSISNGLGEDLSECLLGFHAFTGMSGIYLDKVHTNLS